MKHVMIPFVVKDSEVEKAKTIITEFIKNIYSSEPGTLMYKSFQQKDDPTRFIHVMTFKDEAAMKNHRETSYCKSFVDKLYPICSETPVASEYNQIQE